MAYTLKQLQYFVSIAEHGSLSRAAEQLHRSQSAVSSALAELETGLGVNLFARRRSRGVILTPSGRFALERARSLLREADLLEHEVAGVMSDTIGPVLLGCSSGLATALLPAILDTAAQRHPQIGLDFTLGSQDDLLPRVMSGEIDVAIIPDGRLPTGMRSTSLFSAPVEALLHAEHPLSTEDSVDLARLKDDPFILLDISPGAENAFALFDSIGAQPQLRFRTTSIELTRGLVARGLGFSLVLRRPWQNETYGGLRVVSRPVRTRASTQSIAMVWSAEMRLTSRARVVVDIAHELWNDNTVGAD
ncbi:MAG: putative transcriptional regulator [Subtercola sp.]|nr:putative transcriptional regulator [Subtercola sp.]